MAEPRRMIAIAFGPPTMAQALGNLPRVRAEADCIEFRLDLFEEPFDLAALLRERGSLPAVVTLRPPDQGGRSRLPAAERLRVLLEAASLGAEYVDVEFDAATPEAVAALRAEGARVIVSRHDFDGMPADLDRWWNDLSDCGAHVVKVVGTARHLLDCLPPLRTLQHATRPTIAIAMGAPGLLTRVLALRSDHCFLTYAALDSDQGTAPGQLTASDMRSVYHASRLGPATAVYGLLGPHVETERAREYSGWFAADGIDAVAVPFTAAGEAPEIVSAYRELPVSGWHVHGAELQATVGQALDELSTTACREGKVNAIARRADGCLVGEWVESPREQYALWCSPL